jgi:DNA-binding beta-propeller fold protein YncE
MTSSAMVAFFVPRSMGQAAADSSAAHSAAVNANSAAPVVIASGIAARSLAVARDAATSEGVRAIPLFLTTADQPNRIFSFNAIAPAAAAGSTANAHLAAVAGVGQAGSLGDGGMAAAAELNLKLDALNLRSGVAVAADGTIFIADTQNATIRRIAGPESSEPGVIRSIAGRWAARQAIELVEPMGIALDHQGNLYIADHGAHAVFVMRAALSTAPAALEMLVNARQPGSVAVTPDGSKIFVATLENGAVFAIGTRTHEIESVAGFAGESSSCPASGAASEKQQAGAACPAGLAVDGAGNLFVADAVANHIVRVDAHTAAVTIAAEHLSAPGEISFDPNGNLFISEQGGRRILEIRGLGAPVKSVSLSPASHDFGVEPTRGTSPTFAFTLTNSTNAAITGLNVNTFQGANAADFQTVSTSCTATLAANSSCIINVALAPKDGAVGALAAQLAVTYTGAVNPLTANVTGTGADFQIVLATGQNMIVVVTAGNTATYNLQITPDSNFPAGSPFTVTMVCPLIAPPNSQVIPPGVLPPFTTCTMTPPNMPITPGASIPVAFTVMTTSRKTGILGSVPAMWRGIKPGGRYGPPLFAALLIIFFSALLVAAGTLYPRKIKALRIASCAGVFLAVVALAGGCGGGNGTRINGTPAGTADFLVQATVQDSQGNSLNVTRAITLELIVQ